MTDSDSEEIARSTRGSIIASPLAISSPTTPPTTSACASRLGATKDIFSADALSILHEAAGSSLRDTDRIATAALRTAARKKKKIVERDVLSRILQTESEDRS